VWLETYLIEESGEKPKGSGPMTLRRLGELISLAIEFIVPRFCLECTRFVTELHTMYFVS